MLSHVRFTFFTGHLSLFFYHVSSSSHPPSFSPPQAVKCITCSNSLCLFTDDVESDSEEASGQNGESDFVSSLLFKLSVVVSFTFMCVCVCFPTQCDQVMEFSWSALWNITDETSDNCQMFLNCRGMSLFLECLKVRTRVPSLSRVIIYLLFHTVNLHVNVVWVVQ